MRRPDTTGTHTPRGFTLIELLVVVAIIALLISILLPSLSKARAQARTTLCASRIVQEAKAMLIYAEDYNEEPPFGAHAVQPGDPREEGGELNEEVKGRPGLLKRTEANRENWLTQNITYICGKYEEDWPTGISAAGDVWRDDYVPKSGMLFSYTRFTDLYRCPEFERVSNKSQNVFNYCRSCLGRKWVLPDEPELKPWEKGGFAGGFGHIMKPSQVYAPSQLQIVVDENWQFHVAEPEYFQGRLEGSWECSDPIYYHGQSEIGQYHGAAVEGLSAPPFGGEPKQPERVQRGSIAYYDGHVELVRDWLPGRNITVAALLVPGGVEKLANFIFGELFYQRGIATDMERLMRIIKGAL